MNFSEMKKMNNDPASCYKRTRNICETESLGNSYDNNAV
jgi:hypothetical protein